jgi:hypothetical protein
VLLRSVRPSWMSRAIVRAQLRGGYAETDARWTHAAIYMGDGYNVCEANVGPGKRGVAVAPLWNYCGATAVRVRRPLALSETDGWLLVMTALTQLRKTYDLVYVFRLAVLALRGKGFWHSSTRVRVSPSALVCSTLYADAYTSQTRRVLGEHNGYCTPGFLSYSSDFEDVPCSWLPFGNNPVQPRPNETAL